MTEDTKIDSQNVVHAAESGTRHALSHLEAEFLVEWNKVINYMNKDGKELLAWVAGKLDTSSPELSTPDSWRTLVATLDSISESIAALPAAIATAVVAALPAGQPTDTTAITDAITAGFAALTTEIKTNVEGAPPATAA